MSKKIPDLHKKTVTALLCVGCIFAALQLFLVLRYYEPEVYLYAHGTILADIFNVALALFVIGVLVYFLAVKKDSYPDTLAKTSIITKSFSLLCGVGMLALGISQLQIYIKRTSDMAYIVQRQDKFIMWSGILAIAAFIYFILVALELKQTAGLLPWAGCVVIIWHILYLLAVYFDMTNPLNNPLRLINEFALVGAMMYIVAEIRFLVGVPKKGFYISTSVIAFTLLMASSVSNIAYLIRINSALSSDMICFIYQLFMAGYIVTRLISQLCYKEAAAEIKLPSPEQ